MIRCNELISALTGDPYQLLVRVLAGPEIDHVVPLGPDFSIGSHFSNTVQLDLDCVLPFHARLEAQRDGEAILKCSPGAWLVRVGDGETQAQEPYPGTAFWIEAVQFQFIRRCDVASHMTLCEEPAPRGCRRCGQGMPAGSQYCPRCGLKRTGAMRALVRIAEESPGVYLGDWSPSPSDVVRGYASAMNRLGGKYDRERNDPEAERCYFKAARLGSAEARQRLTAPAIAEGNFGAHA